MLIETGAAVALAFREQLDAGELLVAGAISAGGVEAFQPWPANRRLTVCKQSLRTRCSRSPRELTSHRRIAAGTPPLYVCFS